MLEQYVGIMKARYPGRIEADFEMDDAFDEIFIPRMLIQPIIENAIVHGFQGRPGKVSVSAEIGDNEIAITVEDNGVGMSKDALEKLRESIREDENRERSGLNHVALSNIEHRIKMVCGSEYGLDIESEQGRGTKVTVRLPRRG